MHAPHRALLVVAIVAGAPAVPAAAADPASPFALRSGACAATDEPQTLAVSGADPGARAVIRATVTGGPVAIDPRPLKDRDVAWLPAANPFAGGFSTTVDCRDATDPATYELAYHLAPTLPTSFSGRGDSVTSTVPFVLDRPAHVVGELEVADGVVELPNDPSQTSGGNYNTPGVPAFELGTVRPGQTDLGVRPYGRDVRWTIRLRALPATVGALTLNRAIPAGSVGVRGQFALDRPSRVQVTVNDERGRGVDWPLLPTDLDGGTYPLGWDGRNLAGELVGDGRYELRVRSDDAAGTVSQVAAPVLVDRAGPRVALRAGTIAPNRDIVVTADDTTTGIASLTARVGSPARTLVSMGERSLRIPAPSGGWKPGLVPVQVTAFDYAGNRTAATLRADVREVAGLQCGRDAAIDRVLNTARVASALRKTRAARGRSVAATYAVSRVLCADLDRDGIREMAVLLRARKAAGAATPLVVFRAPAGGQYAPRILSTRYRLSGLRVVGRELRAAVAGGRRLTVREAGGRLVLRVRR